jgi:hypothetical protein
MKGDATTIYFDAEANTFFFFWLDSAPLFNYESPAYTVIVVITDYLAVLATFYTIKKHS